MSTDSHDPRTLLGVGSDASDEEVRRAYKRVRSAYASEATYGLLPAEEVQDIRDRIEAAYATLMDPDRPQRGRPAGRLDPTPTPPLGSLELPPGFLSSVTAPAMAGTPAPRAAREDVFEEYQSQEVGGAGDAGQEESLAREMGGDGGAPPAGAAGVSVEGARSAETTSGPTGTGAAVTGGGAGAAAVVPSPAARFDLELRGDTPVTGDLIRRVREARNVDIRDVSHHTKVSVTQLTAIEKEAFGALPAVVYVRGFVAEYARYLRFPDPVNAARTYVERYRAFLDARGGEGGG